MSNLANLPNRFVAAILRIVIMPFGPDMRGPGDALKTACARVLLEPSPARVRLTAGIFMEAATRSQVSIAGSNSRWPLDRYSKRCTKRTSTIHAAQIAGVIDEGGARALQAVDDAVAAVIAVDDFAADELSLRHVATHTAE